MHRQAKSRKRTQPERKAKNKKNKKEKKQQKEDSDDSYEEDEDEEYEEDEEDEEEQIDSHRQLDNAFYEKEDATSDFVHYLQNSHLRGLPEFTEEIWSNSKLAYRDLMKSNYYTKRIKPKMEACISKIGSQSNKEALAFQKLFTRLLEAGNPNDDNSALYVTFEEEMLSDFFEGHCTACGTTKEISRHWKVTYTKVGGGMNTIHETWHLGSRCRERMLAILDVYNLLMRLCVNRLHTGYENYMPNLMPFSHATLKDRSLKNGEEIYKALDSLLVKATKISNFSPLANGFINGPTDNL